MQNELFLLIASETFFDSSVVPSFLVRKVENGSFPCTHKLCERTGQLWRHNSHRVRTHEKNSRETVRRLGTIIQSIFCAQSGASIHLTVWKWSGESRYPGALPPVLENFRRAFSPRSTDCPWVSEDGSQVTKNKTGSVFPTFCHATFHHALVTCLDQEVWDRETMFSKLAKRSPCVVVSG